MGFYGLLDALKPSARYYTGSKQLVLTASGQAQEATVSIEFTQQTFMGGLKFNFGGWTGPLINPPKFFEYTRSSAFSIDLPNPVTPSNTVIICCRNNPAGEVVKIDFIEEKSKTVIPPMDTSMTASSQDTKGDEMMTVLFKMPFNIMTKAVVGQMTACTITFDPSMLSMTNSSLKGEEMCWMFDSLQTGTTQVVVNTDYGTSTMKNERKIYDVRIIVLGENVGMGTPKMEIPLSWMGMVNMGINLIQRVCPMAELYLVECTPTRIGPVYHPLELSQMRIVCRQVGNRGMAIVKSTGWGQFGPVTKTELQLGLTTVEWPCKVDISKAYELMSKKIGMHPGMVKCNLREAVLPGVEEASYFFQLESGAVCSVGSMTGKVELPSTQI